MDNTTRIKTRIDNDVMTVNVLVDTQAAINEVERDIDFSDIDIIKDIEKLSEIQLVESMEGVIDKAKHYGTDILASLKNFMRIILKIQANRKSW